MDTHYVLLNNPLNNYEKNKFFINNLLIES